MTTTKPDATTEHLTDWLTAITTKNARPADDHINRHRPMTTSIDTNALRQQWPQSSRPTVGEQCDDPYAEMFEDLVDDLHACLNRIDELEQAVTEVPERGSMLEDLMLPAELADKIRVSEGTLKNWRYLSEGPPFLKIGSRVWYSRSAVDGWLADQVVAAPQIAK